MRLAKKSEVTSVESISPDKDMLSKCNGSIDFLKTRRKIVSGAEQRFFFFCKGKRR